jgi:hypothetical protein
MTQTNKVYERPELTDLGEFREETGLFLGFATEFILPINNPWWS